MNLKYIYCFVAVLVLLFEAPIDGSAQRSPVIRTNYKINHQYDVVDTIHTAYLYKMDDNPESDPWKENANIENPDISSVQFINRYTINTNDQSENGIGYNLKYNFSQVQMKANGVDTVLVNPLQSNVLSGYISEDNVLSFDSISSPNPDEVNLDMAKSVFQPELDVPYIPASDLKIGDTLTFYKNEIIPLAMLGELSFLLTQRLIVNKDDGNEVSFESFYNYAYSGEEKIADIILRGNGIGTILYDRNCQCTRNSVSRVMFELIQGEGDLKIFINQMIETHHYLKDKSLK